MTQLVRYDEARRAVQACVTVDEAKDIADKARALQAYAKQAKDAVMESWVAAIRIRARRRMGEISKGLEKGRPSVGYKHCKVRQLSLFANGAAA